MKPSTEPTVLSVKGGIDRPEEGASPSARLSSATASLKGLVQKMAFMRPDREGERVPTGFHPIEFADGEYHIQLKAGTWYNEIGAWKGEQKGEPELIIGIANEDRRPNAPAQADTHVRVVRGKDIWASSDFQKYPPPEQQALVALLEKFDAMLRRNDPPTAGQMRGIVKRKIDQLAF